MTDQKLVDRIVALGVVSKMVGKYWLPYGLNMEIGELPQTVVRDWRVAGALMERLITGELLIWRQAYDNDSPVWIVETHLTNADGRNESLPRAIIEACVAALEDQT